MHRLVLGVPGAGKTTFIGNVRSDLVHIDPDRLRTLHPWWCQGLGLLRTETFNHRLRNAVFGAATTASQSIVEEAVGANPALLLTRIQTALEHGYSIRVEIIEAESSNLKRRRLERSAVTGRLLQGRALYADPKAAVEHIQKHHPNLDVRFSRAVS